MGGVDLVALAPVLRRFENSNGEISDFQLPAEDGNLVKLRPGNYGPIPYLPLKVFGNNDPEDCIKELIVPKSRYFERTKFALSKFLLKKSSEDKIKQSQISIVVPRVELFVERLRKAALKEGYDFAKGPVNYYDFSKDNVSNEYPQIAFQKRREFSYQREFRFLLRKKDGGIDSRPAFVYI